MPNLQKMSLLTSHPVVEVVQLREGLSMLKTSPSKLSMLMQQVTDEKVWWFLKVNKNFKVDRVLLSNTWVPKIMGQHSQMRPLYQNIYVFKYKTMYFKQCLNCNIVSANFRHYCQ